MSYCGIMFILLFLNRVTLLFVGILTLAISLSIVNILPHGRSAFSNATNSKSDKNCVPFNYSTSLMTVGPVESYGNSFNSLIILMFNHFSSNSIIYRFNFCPWLIIFVTPITYFSCNRCQHKSYVSFYSSFIFPCIFNIISNV